MSQSRFFDVTAASMSHDVTKCHMVSLDMRWGKYVYGDRKVPKSQIAKPMKKLQNYQNFKTVKIVEIVKHKETPIRCKLEN